MAIRMLGVEVSAFDDVDRFASFFIGNFSHLVHMSCLMDTRAHCAHEEK